MFRVQRGCEYQWIWRNHQIKRLVWLFHPPIRARGAWFFFYPEWLLPAVTPARGGEETAVFIYSILSVWYVTNTLQNRQVSETAGVVKTFLAAKQNQLWYSSCKDRDIKCSYRTEEVVYDGEKIHSVQTADSRPEGGGGGRGAFLRSCLTYWDWFGDLKVRERLLSLYHSKPPTQKNRFLYIFWWARVCWPLLAYVAHFVFLGDVWIPTQRSKPLRYQLSHPSPHNLVTHLPKLCHLSPHN